MAQPSSPIAGGSLLALSIFAGVIIGAAFGQSSLGFVVGLAIGIAIAVLIWLKDRNA